MTINTAEGISRKPCAKSRVVLGTKAETLERLRSRVSCAVIGEQVCFEVASWPRQRARLLQAVRRRFGQSRLAVRSSSRAEDTLWASNAGQFRSVIDVDASDEESLCLAINSVINSFPQGRPKDQVFIQAMVRDVALAGVGFTCSLSTGAPYYVINYDDQSGRTDTVTRGRAAHPKLRVLHRSVAELPGDANPLIHSVVRAMRELEILVGSDALDIEFAVDRSGTVHLLQVRRIAAQVAEGARLHKSLLPVLHAGQADFRRRQRRFPAVFSSRTLLGAMPDWNPAEMIGLTPRCLAASLYRYLITDDICATQRAAMGYRDIRPNPLMIDLCGHPYIDLRASFSSFIPANVGDDLAERLVDYYLTKLEQEPHLHDKIEFEVAFTSLAFDFTTRAQPLAEVGFSAADVATLRRGLKAVTEFTMARLAAPLSQLKELSTRCDRLRNECSSSLERARQLLRDCRQWGTPAFADLARAAFVAVAFLRSAVNRGLIRLEEMEGFVRSLNTGVKQMSDDAARVRGGGMTWEQFLQHYGHLRPGTYDLSVPSYAEAPEFYLSAIVRGARAEPREHASFEFSDQRRNALQRALREMELPDDIDAFVNFLRVAIEGRECAKFTFTRNLSLALADLARVGADFGLTVDQVSQLTIDDFLQIADPGALGDVGEWLAARARDGQDRHRMAQLIELPPLIARAEQLLSFACAPMAPNFVGSGKVVAPGIEIGPGCVEALDVAGKVALLANGDPGYDWLFTMGVAGLVTLFGGVNSHMAIRAGELDMPAALGVGDAIFRQCQSARMICIDGQARHVQAVA